MEKWWRVDRRTRNGEQFEVYTGNWFNYNEKLLFSELGSSSDAALLVLLQWQCVWPPSCCMEQDPWGETLTSQGISSPKKEADECGVSSAPTGALHFAAPLFNVVILILQQNPMQSKSCSKQTEAGGLYSSSDSTVEAAAVLWIRLGLCSASCGEKWDILPCVFC